MTRLRVQVEELSSLETGVGNSELNTVGVERPVPRAGSTAAEIDTVTGGQKLISSTIDSDAEITVCLPQLAPESPAEESLSGVKHCAPLDTRSRTGCFARQDDFVSPLNIEIMGSDVHEMTEIIAKEIER